MTNYKEMMMAIPPSDLAILKTASRVSVSQGVTLCSAYLPSLPPFEARKFLEFLKQEA